MVLIGHYHFGVVLGRGRFGWVSRATHQVVGRCVAVKHQPWAVGGVTCGGIAGKHVNCQHAEEEKWRAALENEAKLLARVSHPSVVALLEVVRKQTELYVCLEYLGDVTLAMLVSQFYKEKNVGLNEQEASCIFRQVAAGLHHLHIEGILHRDVKPENIMVVPSQNGEMPVAKLIDLGLAVVLDPSSPLNTSRTRAGTIAFMAPELTSPSCDYGPEVDVFSLGASLYFTLVGEAPFTEYKRNGKRGTTALFGLQIHHEDALECLTTQVASLLRNLLHTNPKMRWQLPRILGHDWMLQDYYPAKIISPLTPYLVNGFEVFDKEIFFNMIGKDFFSVEDETLLISNRDEDISEDLVRSSHCKVSITSSDSSVGSHSKPRLRSSISESSINSDQDVGVNMECVDRVSLLLQKDYDHVLQHLGKEPWGPVGGVYNLLLLADIV